MVATRRSSRGMEAVVTVAGMASSRRGNPVGWAPVGERRWGWVVVYWVACCLVRGWAGVVEMTGTMEVGMMAEEVGMMAEEVGTNVLG